MKYKLKLLSLLLVFCLLFAFSGCLKYSSNLLDTATTKSPSESNTFTPGTTLPPQSTLPSEPSLSDIPSSDSVSEPDSSTEIPESTTLPPESTSSPSESTTEAPAESTTAADPSSWSKSEVIEFITTAVNKTKAYTGQITAHRTEELGVTIESISPNLPALKSIANSIISSVVKPIDENLTFTGGKTVNTEGETLPLLLPKRQAFSLPASGVISATASKSGNNIIVNISLASEVGTLNSLPAYNAASMGYLDIGEIDLSVVTVEKLDVTYSGSTMKAVVNADGYVVSADYYIPIAIDASGRALGIPGSFTCTGYQKETWQINW